MDDLEQISESIHAFENDLKKADEEYRFLLAIIAERDTRILQLEEAIKEHAAQRGDDRCFLDDLKLYKLVGIDNHPGLKLQKEEFLSNCSRYWECQQTGKEYKTYEQDQ